jgi:hypothetical protein
MFWLRRSLHEGDFRDEETQFDFGWTYGGADVGWYRLGAFATRDAGDAYLETSSIAGLLVVVDVALFADVGTLAGTIGPLCAGTVQVAAEIQKSKSTRREKEQRYDLARIPDSSPWYPELDNDFGIQVCLRQDLKVPHGFLQRAALCRECALLLNSSAEAFSKFIN